MNENQSTKILQYLETKTDLVTVVIDFFKLLSFVTHSQEAEQQRMCCTEGEVQYSKRVAVRAISLTCL